MKKIESGDGATAYQPPENPEAHNNARGLPADFVPNVSDIGPVNDAYFATKDRPLSADKNFPYAEPEPMNIWATPPGLERRLNDIERRIRDLEDRE
jgi:hypothetical protein